MIRYVVVGVVAVLGFLGADYLEPRIQAMLKLSPENKIGVKAVKYGLVGSLAAASFWVVDKYVK